MQKPVESFHIDERRIRQPETEKPQHIRSARTEYPIFKFIEIASEVGSSNHGAHGRTANDVRHYAGIQERFNDADMRPAARSARTQGKANFWRTG
jgi:hypothetical protein